MMGIKSQQLYDVLTTIVIDKDLSIFNRVPSSELIPQICIHFSDTIPREIFNYDEKSDGNLLKTLKACSDHLEEKFTKRNTYPFTIQRICELSYHPLHYFSVKDLSKFVLSLQKCCLVNTDWTTNLGHECSDSDPSEDVSLIPIDWADSDKNLEQETDVENDKSLQAFIAKIEAIVAVNFGYDDYDDDTEDNRDDDVPLGYDSINGSGNVLIEAYEEVDDEYEDEDYEDHGDGEEDDDEEEEEDEIQEEEQRRESEQNQSQIQLMMRREEEESTSSDVSEGETHLSLHNSEHNNDVNMDPENPTELPSHNNTRIVMPLSDSFLTSASEETHTDDDTDSVSSRKRNVTELDDYQYKEVKHDKNVSTTPKKSKMLFGDYDIVEGSPVLSAKEEVPKEDGTKVNEVVSPDLTVCVTQSGPEDISTSPLQDKKRS